MSSSVSSDCSPLRELRKDLSGDCCTWAGVSCDQRIGRVTAVRWGSIRLVGTIPSSIGGLTNLTDLDLSNNQITGSIPPSIGNLKNLASLDLSDLKLTGTIPTELGGLSSVTWLDLGNNQLTGTVPESLSQLPKLNYLYLYHNQLTGPITKLPNPNSGCNMISTFDEGNNYGCVPLGSMGRCATDLIQNKVPECDAKGNPPPGSPSPSVSRSNPSSSSSRSVGPTNPPSSSGSPSTSDSTNGTLSLPSVIMILPIVVIVGAMIGLLVYYVRRRQSKQSANRSVPMTPTMHNVGNTTTNPFGAGPPNVMYMAGGALGSTGVMKQQQPAYPSAPIHMPQPTFVSPTQPPPATPHDPTKVGGDWQYVKVNTVRVDQTLGGETLHPPFPAAPQTPVHARPAAHNHDEELYLPSPMPGPRREDDVELVLPGDRPVGAPKKR